MSASSDAIAIDAEIARAAIAECLPAYAHLELSPVASAGTDNALFRLGDAYVARFPRVRRAVRLIEKEIACLHRLPRLPLALPVPIAAAWPSAWVPHAWTVCPWLDGAPPENAARLRERADGAALAAFLRALHRSDARHFPIAGADNEYRGAPLLTRDAPMRRALAALNGAMDVRAAEDVWTAALHAPPWRGAPVVIHGDLHAGNVLMSTGRLSAVIDFGLIGAGDPAVDAMAAWTLLEGDARRTFREAMDFDADVWTRARGWALSVGAIALAHYRTTNPALATMARGWIAVALSGD